MEGINYPVNERLLALLACPRCHSHHLEVEGECSDPPAEAIVCTSCRSCYPVVGGIPQMLPAHLADVLEQKSGYLERLREELARGEGGSVQAASADIETDRFMWEHQLYEWGKEVISRDQRALELYASYAQDGARSLCRFITEWAGGVEGKALLYVGSGNDRPVSLPLQEAGAFMVSLDIVLDSLLDLRLAGAQALVCGDLRCLPFRDGAFDVAFSKGSLHHSHPIDVPLQEMARVVKGGGHIVIAEPNRRALLNIPRSLIPPGMARPTPYETSIAARQVAACLGQAGFASLRARGLTHAPPGIPRPLARLWRGLGELMPPIFDRFAFEFILHGRKQ